MLEKCTPLWREAHVEIRSVKTDGPGALLEVEMFKECTPLWREGHFCASYVQSTPRLESRAVLAVQTFKKCTPV